MNNKPKFSNEAGASGVNFTQPSALTLHLAWSEARLVSIRRLGSRVEEPLHSYRFKHVRIAKENPASVRLFAED